MSIFDPDSSVAAEFYVSLHELMSGLESRSSLTWCAIGTLQHACRNPSARAALIHTYKFTPILTRLLGAQLIHDKKLRVLQLLHELTYGVRISWQEAHLPFLISTLTQWIVGNEKELVGLSLGILVNLCYKNLPAVYTLMRSVDIKEFLRTVLKLQRDNVNTRVQVCKLLIIFEHISGEVPASDILNLVNVTFSTLGEAFRSNDVFLLRHIVDFFNDARCNPVSCEVLLTYTRYREDTENLLKLLDGTCDAECVGMLFEFLHQLINLQVTALTPLFPRLMSLALHWMIHNTMACTQSLSLLRTIVVNMGKGITESEIMENILSQLDQGLPVLMVILDNGGEDGFPVNSENRTRLTALIQLLQEMCKWPPLRQKVLTSVKFQSIHRLFQQLLSAEPCGASNLFQEEVTKLYVHALDFISDLSSHNAKWMEVYSELLQHKQVQMVLAVALYTGEESIKRQVLTLTGTVGFPAESVSSLAKSLCDLEPLVMLPSAGVGKAPLTSNSGMNSTHQDMTPLFGMAQEGRLDEFIERLKETLERNEVRDVPMSAVMELYEYKLAALGHSERALHASLEAANNHSTHLQHRLAQMSAEASRLHQLLYHTQQCLEGVQLEKRELTQHLQASKNSADEAHTKHVLEIKNKQKVINELNSQIEDLKRTIILKNKEAESLQMRLTEVLQKCEVLVKQIADNAAEIRNTEAKLQEQTMRNEELTKVMSKLEDKLSKKERCIEENKSEIQKWTKKYDSLKQERNNLEMLCRAHENTIDSKDAELNRLQTQLGELQRMREVIYEISAGKKKMDK
ncbi:protein CIP2A isoform X2 [Anabrus simplex]